MTDIALVVYQMRNTTFPAFFKEFEEAEVHSVPEMIKWNVDHADQCLPLGEFMTVPLAQRIHTKLQQNTLIRASFTICCMTELRQKSTKRSKRLSTMKATTS